jgi:hypothetical protein
MPKTTAQTAASKASAHRAALAAFIAHKASIDAALTALQAASADHFGIAPDEVYWAHVGDASRLAAALEDLLHAYNRTGEYEVR